MHINLETIGRRFNRDWIFRNISYSFHPGQKYAILGPNGSGKSTLLHILSGSLSPSEGTLSYTLSEKPVETEAVYRHIVLAAPYLELIEEYTLDEMIGFHFSFKDYLPGVDAQGLKDLLGLDQPAHKEIKYFSSGMKQRTRLALAFCSNTPVLLLDEPTSNLDTQGIDWYLGLTERFTAGRTVIIGSNQEHEYAFCPNRLQVTDYKS